MKVEIVDSRKIPSGDAGRIGKWDRLITYQTDALNKFIVTVPEESLTSDAAGDTVITAAIKADMETRAKHVGKLFEI